MNLPPLYKYLDINGAIATLNGQTFKWTKPSDFKVRFKDDMDMTISKLFPEELEESLESLKYNFVDTLANNNNQQLTYSDLRLTLIQQAFLNKPDIANTVKKELQQDSISDLYDIDRIRRVLEEYVNEINTFLQGYRVLCTSNNILSERMWQDYADDKKGLALRIEPSPISQKDSIFKLFKAVQYVNQRPPLFESTLDFLESSLFEEKQTLTYKAIDRVIYSKTDMYSYESEYRCVVPLRPKEEYIGDIFLHYHAEEITGLYFGENAEDSNKYLFIKLAKKINPDISIYQISNMKNGSLYANDISHECYQT